MTDANTAPTAPSWRRAWELARPELWASRKTLAFGYLAGLIAVGALLLLPWPLKLIIDQVLSDKAPPAWLLSAREFTEAAGLPLDAVGQVILFSSAYLLIALAVTLAGSAEKMAGARVRERMVLRIRDKILGHIQQLSPGQYAHRRSGDLGLHILVDVQHLVRLLTKTVPLIIRHLLITLFTLGVMFIVEPRLAAAGLLIVVMLALLVRIQGRILRDRSRFKRACEGDVAGFTQECMKGMPTVRALTAEKPVRARFQQINRASLRAGILETAAAVNMERTMQALNGVAVASIMGGGALLVLHGQLTLGDLTVFIAYMVQLLKPVEKINDLASAVSRGLSRAELLSRIIEIPPDMRDGANARTLPSGAGLIQLRDVGYSHDKGETWVLRHIDMLLQPGELTVLTGPSGAGKSTLLQIVCRQLEPALGEIRFDGHAYTELTLASLRSRFAVMLQHHHLFSGPLRDALWLSERPVDEQRLWDALAMVDMSRHVRSLPNGLDTRLEEDAGNFSGGQRARLSLARALLLDRPVLLLDEPLANIDLNSQHIILDALDRIRQGKTCLAISHQAALRQRADQVLWLENGVISKPESATTMEAVI